VDFAALSKQMVAKLDNPELKAEQRKATKTMKRRDGRQLVTQEMFGFGSSDSEDGSSDSEEADQVDTLLKDM